VLCDADRVREGSMRNIERHIIQTIVGVFLFLLIVRTASAAPPESTHHLSVPGNVAWIDTDLAVSIGDRVAISATGTISIGCNVCPDRQTAGGSRLQQARSIVWKIATPHGPEI
jgi:hypothetical protein